MKLIDEYPMRLSNTLCDTQNFIFRERQKSQFIFSSAALLVPEPRMIGKLSEAFINVYNIFCEFEIL